MGAKKWAEYGLKDSRKRQWCGDCAKTHGGVYLSQRQMCEDCHDKHAHYGKVGSTKRQWCGECAQAHGGVC